LASLEHEDIIFSERWSFKRIYAFFFFYSVAEIFGFVVRLQLLAKKSMEFVSYVLLSCLEWSKGCMGTA